MIGSSGDRAIEDPSSSDDPITRWSDHPMLVVSFSQLHLAAKHTIDEGKVGHCQYRAQCPPNQPDAQSVTASGSVVNGQAELMVAGWQYDRIERKRRPHQHRNDIQAGGNKRELFFALG